MSSIFRGLLAQPTPDQALVGNNFAFYAVVGGVLLLVLLPMVLWLRRRRG